MTGLPLLNALDAKYKGSFTLMNAINDSLISENVEKFYVPQVEIKSSIFIKKDESIAITPTGPRRIRFVYLNPQGKNLTNPDSSFIQIAPSRKGFLARLSISRNTYTAVNLELDYFIDIENIKYKIDSVMMSENNEILLRDVLKFDNLDFNEYSKINFDPLIKDFIIHKEELFEMYF